MKNRKNYVLYFLLFPVLVLDLLFLKENHLFVYSFISVIVSVIMLIEYPKATIPRDSVEFGKNTLKQFFQVLNSLEQYKKITFWGARIFFIISVGCTILGIIMLN